MRVATPESTTSEQLTVRGVATAASAAELRDRFRTWLADRGVGEPQVAEVLLVVNEALANCVDHAYVDHPSVGEMSVQADFEPQERCLSVCVTDHGTWRQPGSRQRRDSSRGRGVILMHALAHHCTINGRPDGTTVCLDYRCP